MDLKVSDGKKGQLPRNSHAAAYTVSALFRNGKAVLNIFSDVQPVSAGQKESAGGIAFSQPSKGTEYQDYIELVQFGDNKEWKKFRCMFDMNGESIMREYRYVHKYLLCDLDGDGQSELAAYHNGSGSLWQQMVVYRLINGVPERSFSVKP